MKDKNGKQIKIGSKVVWYDPEVSARDLKRIWVVYDIDDEIVYIGDDYSEAEVFAEELEVVEWFSFVIIWIYQNFYLSLQ